MNRLRKLQNIMPTCPHQLLQMNTINQSLKEKHDKIKDMNRVLIRENMKLYRQLRLLRLKLKESRPPTQDQTGLETLAELATTIVDIPQSST
jgi:hypothetical protein